MNHVAPVQTCQSPSVGFVGHVLRPTDHWGFIEAIVNQDETSHYLVKALILTIIGTSWLLLDFKPSLLFPLLPLFPTLRNQMLKRRVELFHLLNPRRPSRHGEMYPVVSLADNHP